MRLTFLSLGLPYRSYRSYSLSVSFFHLKAFHTKIYNKKFSHIILRMKKNSLFFCTHKFWLSKKGWIWGYFVIRTQTKGALITSSLFCVSDSPVWKVLALNSGVYRAKTWKVKKNTLSLALQIHGFRQLNRLQLSMHLWLYFLFE